MSFHAVSIVLDNSNSAVSCNGSIELDEGIKQFPSEWKEEHKEL